MRINIHNVVERAIHTSIEEFFNLNSPSYLTAEDIAVDSARLSAAVMNGLSDVIEFEDQYFELKERLQLLNVDTLVLPEELHERRD
jgi:hypothetical protein